MAIIPTRPKNIALFAEVCLDALARSAKGHLISIGGAFGLAHYLEYRSTYDIDAWWQPGTSQQDRQAIIALISETLSQFGDVRTRTWGDVSSITLFQDNRVVFSFQIANRDVQLADSLPSSWEGVALDSFVDLIASKMTALVERGAPRDYRDIFAVCRAGLISPQECWELWKKRQELSGIPIDCERARLAVQTHLERIALHRPLTSIEDPQARLEAKTLREWFLKDFLDALA